MKRLLLALVIFILVTSWEPHQVLRAQVMGQAVTFQWEMVLEREDNTPLLNLAGYKLYQSAEAGVYGAVPAVDLDNPGLSTYVLEGVGEGLWYWVLTAYDANGLESGYSNEVSKIIVGIPSPPKAPAAFLVVN